MLKQQNSIFLTYTVDDGSPGYPVYFVCPMCDKIHTFVEPSGKGFSDIELAKRTFRNSMQEMAIAQYVPLPFLIKEMQRILRERSGHARV